MKNIILSVIILLFCVVFISCRNNARKTSSTKVEGASIKASIIRNLIIIDESGSMSSARDAAIDGCNETLNTICTTSKEMGDSITQLVSIYAFDTDLGHSHYIIRDEPIEKVRKISRSDYSPNGTTPLLDAVGSSLTNLKIACDADSAVGIVTIITDGFENASKEWSWEQVRDLITELRLKGWDFSFIGANIDVDEYGERLNIQNRSSFRNDRHGTREMFRELNESYRGRLQRLRR